MAGRVTPFVAAPSRTGHWEVDEMIILLAIVVVAVSVPLASVVLVSLASKREDSAQSLGGRPAGRLEAAARRMVGFHSDGVARRPGARLDHPRLGHTGLGHTGLDGTGFDGTGLNGTGFDGTGLNGTGLNGTGLNGTGFDGTGFLADKPDVPHLVG
jgi:hypothetical protein